MYSCPQSFKPNHSAVWWPLMEILNCLLEKELVKNKWYLTYTLVTQVTCYIQGLCSSKFLHGYMKCASSGKCLPIAILILNWCHNSSVLSLSSASYLLWICESVHTESAHNKVTCNWLFDWSVHSVLEHKFCKHSLRRILAYLFYKEIWGYVIMMYGIYPNIRRLRM
jgi:hypothetical protein